MEPEFGIRETVHQAGEVLGQVQRCTRCGWILVADVTRERPYLPGVPVVECSKTTWATTRRPTCRVGL